MKHLRLLLPILALNLACVSLHAQSLSSFTPGDLVVEEVGNGTTALSGTAAAVFFDEYTPAGLLVGNVALPSTGAGAITDGGTGGTDGMITLSPNGEFLAFSGFNAPVGTSGVTGTATTAVQRVGGTVSFDGTVTTDLLGTTAFNGAAARGAFATDPSDVWVNGKGNSTTDGIWFNNGSSSTLVANSNLRTIGYSSGQLLAANGTNILAIGSGLPTSGNFNPTISSIIATSGTALGQFVLVTVPGSGVSGPNTLYVADSGSATKAILKYTLTSGTLLSGTWVANGTASISAFANTGAFGLTGVLDGNGSVTIYGTSSNSSNNAGSLFALTDSSGYEGNLTGSATEIAAASANETFRGVAFAPSPSITPVPEPATFAALFGAGVLGVSAALRRRALVAS